MTARAGACLVAVTLVAATAVALLTSAASAHGVDPTVKTVIDAVEPAAAGLIVQVADSVSTELLVDNPTGTDLEVLADTGEPFLRIGPRGVEANISSPSWYLTNEPLGDTLPAGIEAGAAPRWVVVSATPTWGWFDHRLHPAQVTLADADAHRAWSVPTLFGGQPGQIRGHVERRRFAGSYTARLVAGAQPLPGVSVQILDGRTPGLFVRNTGTQPVTVLGAAGEPFARIGPSGAEVNRRSPTYVASAQASGVELDPSIAVDAAAPPDWVRASPEASYAWIDARGRYPNEEPPESAARAPKATVVLDWRVPLEQGTARAEVRAVTAWVPAAVEVGAPSGAGSSNRGLVLGLIAGPILLLGAIAIYARNRRRADA